MEMKTKFDHFKWSTTVNKLYYEA